MIRLIDRALLEVSGPDASAFLQGLITNDINKVNNSHSLYAALLTPQGKFVTDFFVIKTVSGYLLDTNKALYDTLFKRLTLYKLRANIQLINQTDHYHVHALLTQTDKSAGTTVFDPISESFEIVDPRTEAMGSRLYIKSTTQIGTTDHDAHNYEYRRIGLGIAEGYNDITSEHDFPLDYGLKERHAIDFKKGCYVGQEVTARMEYRGTVRKRIYTVQGQLPLPQPKSDITHDGLTIGHLCSSSHNLGLALLKSDEPLPHNTLLLCKDQELRIVNQ